MIRSGLSFGGKLKQILIVTFLFIGCGDEDGTESNSTEAYCLLYQDSEVGQVQTCDYYANLSEAQLQTAQNACISQTVPGNWRASCKLLFFFSISPIDASNRLTASLRIAFPRL